VSGVKVAAVAVALVVSSIVVSARVANTPAVWHAIAASIKAPTLASVTDQYAVALPAFDGAVAQRSDPIVQLTSHDVDRASTAATSDIASAASDIGPAPAGGPDTSAPATSDSTVAKRPTPTGDTNDTRTTTGSQSAEAAPAATAQQTATNAAAAPPAPPPPPPPAQPMLGFDTCETPSVDDMQVWKDTSPYAAVGIYIGGTARNCPNTALDTPAWVAAVVAQGWHVIPTYVGLQAPCSDFNARMDPASSVTTQGIQSADDAADHAVRAGIGQGAPIYFDLESHDPDPACSEVVKTFLSAWTHRLHERGYVSGLYGNLDSGIGTAASMVGVAGYEPVDAIWIAAWTGTGQLTGFGTIPDGVWSGAQRMHQFVGDHDETWGGVTIDIDTDLVHAPVYPT
jgi:glycoside hydrolase-like protein